MMNWEYKTVICSPKFAFSIKGIYRDVESDMNALGQDGWELVGFLPGNSGLAVFKRQLVAR